MTLVQRELALEKASRLISTSKHLVVFTGAGISTPSGIPDFRSQTTGLWNRFDPMEVASRTAFRLRPEKFFQWIGSLYQQIAQAQPNAAHLSLARLETAGLLKAVITQNIDSLHQSAGNQVVIELHGSLRQMICSKCNVRVGAFPYAEDLIQSSKIPTCPNCSATLKPDIVLYEEMLPEDAWQAAQQYCESSDVLWVIGSSLEVYPAAYLPSVAIQVGAQLVITNFSSTPLDQDAEVLLPFDLAQVVPEIVESILGKG